MLPDIHKSTPEKRFLHAAALVVSETIAIEQGALYAGCTVSALVDALHDPEVVQAVEAEVTRLRYSGDLATLKAARLTDSMLEKLLATPIEELSTGTAMKLAELGLRFREKSAADSKTQTLNAKVLILKDGDPDPLPDPDAKFVLTIDLRNKLKPVRMINHEGVSDAE